MTKKLSVSAKLWIFTIAILWGLTKQNWKNRQNLAKNKSYLS